MIQSGLIILAGVVGFWFVLSMFNARRQHRRLVALSNSRSADFIEFRQHFPSVPVTLLQKVYSLVQKLTGVQDFRVLPSDDLCGLLDIDQGTLESELEDTFGTISNVIGPLVTVADIVAALEAKKTAATDRSEERRSG